VRKYINFNSALLIFPILLSSYIFCSAGETLLEGGCSKVNITPPLGIPLIGSKGKPSDDILDELYAKALVLNDGRTIIAIVSVDLLYTSLEEITNPVRAIIKEKIGIPEQNVLICATHTHSGPEVFTKSKLGLEKKIPACKIDHFYLQTLIRKIADSVLLACKNTQRVKIGAAKGQIPEILYNRRCKKPDGSVTMEFTLAPEVITTKKIKREPEGYTKVTFTFPDEETELDFGPVDPEVCLLRVEDTEGRIVGSLVNFGCHPVCIYPSLNTTISADYPAYATQVVEQMEGGICLFTLGLAGDTVPIQRGLQPREQMGKTLGAEALKKLQFVSTSDDVTLKALKKEIKFLTKKIASQDVTAEDGETVDYIMTEIQVLKLGDVYILGLPGEVLVEVGLQIKKRAGLQNLFIVTLSNDTIGYVCHSQAYEEGGYEVGSGTNLANGAGEIMIKEALDLINEIKKVDSICRKPIANRSFDTKDLSQL